MDVVILKYNAGNTASVKNALANLGVEAQITDDAAQILKADRVIFPGVGEASSAMRHLQAKGLDKLIRQLRQPTLGICLGMQLMCSFTEEGQLKGLDIFDTPVRRFPPQGIIPHMGWNNVENTQGPLFKNIAANPDFYFVHSFYAENSQQTIGQCNYLLPFAAALHSKNFYAVQFHPEKSGAAGSQLLKNFLDL